MEDQEVLHEKAAAIQKIIRGTQARRERLAREEALRLKQEQQKQKKKRLAARKAAQARFLMMRLSFVGSNFPARSTCHASNDDN